MFDHRILYVIRRNERWVQFFRKGRLRQDLQAHQTEKFDEGAVIGGLCDGAVKDEVQVVERGLVFQRGFELAGSIPDI